MSAPDYNQYVSLGPGGIVYSGLALSVRRYDEEDWRGSASRWLNGERGTLSPYEPGGHHPQLDKHRESMGFREL